MTSDSTSIEGPDLTVGIPTGDLPVGGILQGHVGDEPVILVRRNQEIFAVGAKCTHYAGPLAEGIVENETIRCPWHHACFSVRTGEATAAPAFDPIVCWNVEQRDGRIFVKTKQQTDKPFASPGAVGEPPPG
jgi:nitrite reductase/ring-hydroxylating ferredoxin subunit